MIVCMTPEAALRQSSRLRGSPVVSGGREKKYERLIDLWSDVDGAMGDGLHNPQSVSDTFSFSKDRHVQVRLRRLDRGSGDVSNGRWRLLSSAEVAKSS